MGVLHRADSRPSQGVRAVFVAAGHPWRHVLLPAAGFLAAFALFAATLVPGVLSGDAGEFAYQPLVLGIPHPNGYPFYLLTGALWQRLVPFGEPAWKMNLFSAFWGALAVAWLVAWLRRALPAWGAALVAGLALALWPDFWRYSTATAVYSLHAFFLVVTLERLHAWWEHLAEGKPSARAAQTFFLAAGLGASNHLTFNIFLLALSPLVVALLRAEVRRGGLPRLMRLVWPLGVGALSYAYLPWRAWALGRPDPAFPELPGLTPAVARGLISPFYRPGLAGFLDYVLGRSLLTDLSAGWADVPPLWWERVWKPLGPGWLLLALVGLLALWRRHRGGTLTLMAVYALSGTLALKYWRDFAANQEVAHVEGHLMAVHIIHVLLIAVGSAAIWSWGRTLRSSAGRLLAAGVPLLLFVPQAFSLAARPPSADQEESPAIQAYWDEALAQPLAPEAGLMAHWGDLTPFWYQQHALGRRPDLVGLFPPGAELAEAWLRAGRPLYLAGPLLDWGADVPARFRLVPDGLFVRVELPGETPAVPEDGPRFGDALRLVAHEVPQTWREGQFVALTLRWVAEAPVSRDMLLALRLRDADGRIVAEWHRRFASLWDPRATLPAGQEVISRPRLPVPWGLPAGTYTLEMDLFDPATGEAWSGIDEQGAAVTWPISVEAAEKGPAPRELRAHGFQGMALWRTLRLVGAEVRGDTFYPGQELPVTLTWLSVGRRPRQYTVQLRLVPADGGADAQVWQVPLEAGGRWPDSTVTDVRRQVVRLRLAPSVRAGRYRLVLSLIRAGKVEPARVSLWHRVQDLPLADVIVAEYERLPHLPDNARPLGIAFGGVVELLGYEWRGREVTLYWRARREVPLNLSVFVHLLDADGRVVAQADHVPQAGRAPTSGWWPGTVIPDSFTLPVALEPGWRLRVGLYDPVSGARLPRDDGGDGVELPVGAERESP